MLNVIGVYCLLVYVSAAYGQKEIGDNCTLESENSGICVLLKNCQEAIVSLTVHQKFPQTCGFQGTLPIVCCSQAGSAITSPRPAQTPKTTRTTTATTPRTTMKATIKPESVTRHTQLLQSRQPGDISKQKCIEYGEYVYVLVPVPTLPIEPEYEKKNECGIKAVTLIVGDTNKAEIKEFPHMALIGYGTSPNDIEWLCGGSLISEKYILTAAHCLFSRDRGDAKFVKMGITNKKDTSQVQDFYIAERKAHPDYSPPSHYNDIALLKLETPAKLNPYVRPACLFPEQPIPVKKAITTGWGQQEFGAEEGSDDLLKVTLEVYGSQECNKSYRNQISDRKLKRGIVENIQLCYGSRTEDKDACGGDSGGPLQITHQKDDVKCMYDLIGVTSFGKACGIGNQPGVYTRIHPYLKWIEDIVWNSV